MNVANHLVLRANLARGTLQIQNELVYMQMNNLNNIATLTSLILSFTHVGLVEVVYPTYGVEFHPISVVYYIFTGISFMCCLLILSQSTIEVIWGPQMALNGTNVTDVMDAVTHMKEKQKYLLKVAIVMSISLLIETTIYSYAIAGLWIGIMINCILFAGSYIIWQQGRKAYIEFNEGNLLNQIGDEMEDEKMEIEMSTEQDSASIDQKGKGVKYSKMTTKEKIDRIQDIIEETTIAINQKKARGIVWKKNTISKGSLFEKCFAVLEKGTIDFYKSEDDFISRREPMNKVPLKLEDYDLISNQAAVAVHSTNVLSVTGSFKQAMLGSKEVSMTDAMTADFDVQFATKNCKFILLPKVTSELRTSTPVECMAEDLDAFAGWTKIIQAVIDLYSKIADMQHKDISLRGTTDVEKAVTTAVKVNI